MGLSSSTSQISLLESICALPIMDLPTIGASLFSSVVTLNSFWLSCVSKFCKILLEK